MIERIFQWFVAPRRLLVGSVMRVLLGAVGLFFLISHFRQRYFLWGQNGQVTWQIFMRGNVRDDPTSLFTFSDSPHWMDVLYALGIIVALLFIFGVLPRIATVAFYITQTSFLERNPLGMDGGHNIFVLVVFYLIFADTGEYFALFTLRKLPAFREAYRRHFAAFVAIINNCAWIVILGQICLLYFWSGFYKVTGPLWQNGTAIYYVLRTKEFSLPGVSQLVYEHWPLIAIGTYATIIFQMGFPFLMWNQRLKPVLFVVATMFHAGIALFMGLTVFSLTMMVVDLAIFSDRTLLSMQKGIAGVSTAVWERLMGSLRAFKGTVSAPIRN